MGFAYLLCFGVLTLLTVIKFVFLHSQSLALPESQLCWQSFQTLAKSGNLLPHLKKKAKFTAFPLGEEQNTATFYKTK